MGGSTDAIMVTVRAMKAGGEGAGGGACAGGSADGVVVGGTFCVSTVDKHCGVPAILVTSDHRTGLCENKFDRT